MLVLFFFWSTALVPKWASFSNVSFVWTKCTRIPRVSALGIWVTLAVFPCSPSMEQLGTLHPITSHVEVVVVSEFSSFYTFIDYNKMLNYRAPTALTFFSQTAAARFPRGLLLCRIHERINGSDIMQNNNKKAPKLSFASIIISSILYPIFFSLPKLWNLRNNNWTCNMLSLLVTLFLFNDLFQCCAAHLNSLEAFFFSFPR